MIHKLLRDFLIGVMVGVGITHLAIKVFGL
jgi:F0F1-type ATP synthase assembly protein I